MLVKGWVSGGYSKEELEIVLAKFIKAKRIRTTEAYKPKKYDRQITIEIKVDYD